MYLRYGVQSAKMIMLLLITNKNMKKIKALDLRYKMIVFAMIVFVVTGSTLILAWYVSSVQSAALVNLTVPSPTPSSHVTASSSIAASKKSAAVARKSAAAVVAATHASAVVVAPHVVAPATNSTNYRGAGLYVDPSLARQGREAPIASQPIAQWFGDFTSNVQASVDAYVSAATAQGTLGTLVAYNIPNRDCGSYSSGGARSAADYSSWIRSFAAGIGQRRAIVIVEPDALPGMDCLSTADQVSRLKSIADAVSVLRVQTKAYIYLDVGNVTWQSAATMAARLKRADVAATQGFSVNVSGFVSTSLSAAYGESLSSQLGGKHYVIDTSRNGKGALTGEWCNPAGRGLGHAPTTSTSYAHADAYLWIKVPGESDGTCNGGPSAGQWFDSYARELIANR